MVKKRFTFGFLCFSFLIFSSNSYAEPKISENLSSSLNSETGPTNLINSDVFKNEIEDFDKIVDQLSEEQEYSSQIQTTSSKSILSEAFFHGSLGMTLSLINFRHSLQRNFFEPIQGVEINFGINLFSPYWISEGVFKFFNPSEITEKAHFYGREFNLKLIRKVFLKRFVYTRLGVGFMSRYLTLVEEDKTGESQFKPFGYSAKKTTYITPSINILFGFEFPLGSFVSLTTEVDYAFSLLGSSADRQSLGTGFKFSAYF